MSSMNKQNSLPQFMLFSSINTNSKQTQLSSNTKLYYVHVDSFMPIKKTLIIVFPISHFTTRSTQPEQKKKL